MALAIDDLQVQTEWAQAAPSTSTAFKPQTPPMPDFRAEMEKVRERELRLKAD
jgi:hypothetical protein